MGIFSRVAAVFSGGPEVPMGRGNLDAGLLPLALARHGRIDPALPALRLSLALIAPPIGLSLWIVNGIARDVPQPAVLRGAKPFMVCMILANILLFICRRSRYGCPPH